MLFQNLVQDRKRDLRAILTRLYDKPVKRDARFAGGKYAGKRVADVFESDAAYCPSIWNGKDCWR
jgi:hypothetical protein